VIYIQSKPAMGSAERVHLSLVVILVVISIGCSPFDVLEHPTTPVLNPNTATVVPYLGAMAFALSSCVEALSYRSRALLPSPVFAPSLILSRYPPSPTTTLSATGASSPQIAQVSSADATGPRRLETRLPMSRPFVESHLLYIGSLAPFALRSPFLSFPFYLRLLPLDPRCLRARC
jgi:hypothetical protein